MDTSYLTTKRFMVPLHTGNRKRVPTVYTFMSNRRMFELSHTCTHAGLMVVEKLILMRKVIFPNHPNFKNDLYSSVRELVDAVYPDENHSAIPYQWGSD